MSYSSFAQVYDALTFNVGYKDRADYICELLRRNGCEKGILAVQVHCLNSLLKRALI